METIEEKRSAILHVYYINGFIDAFIWYLSRTIIVICCFCLIYGCSSDRSECCSLVVTSTTESMILEAKYGTLDIPAGALEVGTHVSMTSGEDSILPSQIEQQGMVCYINFDGSTPKEPATLTLNYRTNNGNALFIPLVAVRTHTTPDFSSGPLQALPANGLIQASVISSGTYVAALLPVNAIFASLTPGIPKGTLPESWTPIPGTGTGDYEMKQLYAYWEDPGYLTELLGAIYAECTTEALSDSTKARILNKCAELPCPDNLVCTAKIVHEQLEKDPDNVCRNYASAIVDAAEVLGLDASFQAGWEGLTGHAWAEVECDGKTYVIDPFGGAYISID